MRITALSFVAMISCVLITGCSEPDDGDAAKTASGSGEPDQTVESTESGGPKVSVKAHKAVALVPGDEFSITVTAVDFTLDDSKIDQANEDAVGHYRIYWDDATGDDYIATGSDATVNISVPAGTTDGSHQVRAVLFNNDQSPVTPEVEGSAWVLVYRLDE